MFFYTLMEAIMIFGKLEQESLYECGKGIATSVTVIGMATSTKIYT